MDLPTRHPDGPPAPGSGGFTLVEVVIALIVLTVGLLGLAGTTGHVVRQVNLADLMTERAAAFQTAIDRIQSLEYDSVTTGQDTVGIFEVEWSSVDDGSQNKVVTLVTTGPGLDPDARLTMMSREVVDTFTFRVLRR